MANEINDIVVIDRFDYDELVSRANATNEKIEKEVEETLLKRTIVPVKIEFYEYRNNKNFSAPISFSRGFNASEIDNNLDELEPKIRAWMDENLSIYDKKLRDQGITERNCIGFRKRVANLEHRARVNKIKYIYLFCYAAIMTITVCLFLIQK